MANTNTKQSGYIALISAIIICAVLVIISASISATGFFSRFSVLDTEDKQQGNALAEGCEDSALLRLAQNPADTTTASVTIGSYSCNVVAVLQNTPVAGQATIETKAVVNNSVTNLIFVVSNPGLGLISWQEVPNL